MSLISILSTNLLILTLYMTVWFSASYFLKRLDVVDIAWGGGFIIAALASYTQSPHFYSGLLLVLVGIWGLRLSLHIGIRNHGKKNDPRYDALSKKWNPRTYWWHAYASIFLLQGILIFFISLPVSIEASSTFNMPTFGAVLGSVVWGIGLIIETIADHQLRHFVQTRTAEHPVMDQGLWRYSRHPNYFGEIMVWCGIALIASSAPYGWLAWLGPLCLTYLIVWVSGIPPIEKRKKDDPKYQAYAKRTSMLIPLPPKN